MTGSGHLSAVRDACRSYLTRAGLHYLEDADGDFVVPFAAGIQVFVMPRELPDGRTVVKVEALCVKDLRIDGDLGIFLAEESGRMLFGKLALYSERKEVRLEHALLGDYLNQAELESAVDLVAAGTDLYDDLLRERWGGRKPAEL